MMPASRVATRAAEQGEALRRASSSKVASASAHHLAKTQAKPSGSRTVAKPSLGAAGQVETRREKPLCLGKVISNDAPRSSRDAEGCAGL